MTLKQIAALGKKLVVFLSLFADCFRRREGRELLRVYVQGQLSDLQRKTAEAIAVKFATAPRYLGRSDACSFTPPSRGTCSRASLRIWP